MTDVFEVPESEAEKPENRYKFKVEGKECDIPLLSHVDYAVLQIISRNVFTDTEADVATYDFFAHLVGDEEKADAIRRLKRDQLDALSDAYRKASGITEGESSASSSS